MKNLFKEQVIRSALDHGFDAVAVTSATPAEHGEALDRWLAEGCQGDMGWMGRDPERRKNIRRVAPWAQSVVVVAWNYYVKNSVLRSDFGVVARYARGKDYHKVMQKKLRQLAEFFVKIGGLGTQARIAVDTSAVLERDLARRSGLAWIGKSTMALNRQLGTWFLLGEIITTLDLEVDSPSADRCGTCVRCIRACPTQAIIAPYQLDARKCISYLTIETKGDIPKEYRRAVGNRIFGCDECLAVCPWNRFAREARSFREIYRNDMVQLDARIVLEMNLSEFNEKFQGTPIRRLGLERLQRNACVVLGNVGNLEDATLLESVAANHESLMVRRHAVWGVDEILVRSGHVKVI